MITGSPFRGNCQKAINETAFHGDVSSLALFLSSDGAEFIIGQVISVDGGYGGIIQARWRVYNLF